MFTIIFINIYLLAIGYVLVLMGSTMFEFRICRRKPISFSSENFSAELRIGIVILVLLLIVELLVGFIINAVWLNQSFLKVVFLPIICTMLLFLSINAVLYFKYDSVSTASFFHSIDRAHGWPAFNQALDLRNKLGLFEGFVLLINPLLHFVLSAILYSLFISIAAPQINLFDGLITFSLTSESIFMTINTYIFFVPFGLVIIYKILDYIFILDWF